MSHSTLFISDLHLDPERESINRVFFDFIEQRAQQADVLYVLGDLFEAWIGDDDLTEFNNSIISAFRKFSANNKQLFFMHGNRDFLLGDEFMKRCGGTLLEDPTVIDLYGKKTLLCHGDTLCTLDHEYQAFRKTVRSERWIHEVMQKTLSERRQLAADMRKQSREKGQNKAENIVDVNPDDVLKLVELTEIDFLIHGHTHRPAEHSISTSFGTCNRLVLGDWYNSGHCLEFYQQGYHTEIFKI